MIMDSTEMNDGQSSTGRNLMGQSENGPLETGLAGKLRQILAVLESERQALAEMDMDLLMLCAQDKGRMCNIIETGTPHSIDAECRGLLEAARHQNEVNRKVRNLLAANVAARIDVLMRAPGIYTSPKARRATF